MKRFFTLLISLALISAVNAQTPINDTAALRNYINTVIVSNGARLLTATHFNTVFNGIANLMKAYAVDSAYISNDTIYLTRRGGFPSISLKLPGLTGGGLEIDPTVPALVKGITPADTTRWGKPYIDSIFRSNDSVYFYKNGQKILAYIDSVGAGGGGGGPEVDPTVPALVKGITPADTTWWGKPYIDSIFRSNDSVYFYKNGQKILAYIDSVGTGGGLTEVEVEEIVGTAISDSLSRPFTVPIGGSLDATLTSSGVDSLHLENDVLNPGNNKLYGTNSAGVKGWYDQPSGGEGGGPTNLSLSKSSTTNTISNDNGTGVVLSVATGTEAGLMSAADKRRSDTSTTIRNAIADGDSTAHAIGPDADTLVLKRIKFVAGAGMKISKSHTLDQLTYTFSRGVTDTLLSTGDHEIPAGRSFDIFLHPGAATTTISTATSISLLSDEGTDGLEIRIFAGPSDVYDITGFGTAGTTLFSNFSVTSGDIGVRIIDEAPPTSIKSGQCLIYRGKRIGGLTFYYRIK